MISVYIHKTRSYVYVKFKGRDSGIIYVTLIFTCDK